MAGGGAVFYKNRGGGAGGMSVRRGGGREKNVFKAEMPPKSLPLPEKAGKRRSGMSVHDSRIANRFVSHPHTYTSRTQVQFKRITLVTVCVP